MKPERVQIGGIPALLYGAPAERGYLFLHGQMGRKEEAEDGKLQVEKIVIPHEAT